MDPPSPAAVGGQSERRTQQERLRREEAYYHFINGLSEEEYRLMRDSDLLGTPGEVTAEELRQRLDGAKERLSTQPHPQSGAMGGENESMGVEAAAEASSGDSLLEWLNTFRRTGNATRSGQSGNQTWRAVSRTNPNSGEFRFSLEININHEQPETPPPSLSTARHTPFPLLRPAAQSRRVQPQRTLAHHGATAEHPISLRRGVATAEHPISLRRGVASAEHPISLRRGVALEQTHPTQTPTALPLRLQAGGGWDSTQRRPPPEADGELEMPDTPDCVLPRPGPQGAPRSSRTRARGRGCRARAGGHRRTSRRSRSPLRPTPSTSHMEPANQPAPEPQAPPPAEPTEDVESQASGGGSARRHPTIMLDLQVRRIRPGENRDRDSVASRTRSRARAAENTVTFESDSGGFRRTISRSERAGVRTYVSTIRIPLRRISETGLGEPSSAALRSILRQIMTGFGELSSLMETEAADAAVAGGPTVTPGFRVHGDEAEQPAADRRLIPEGVEEGGERAQMGDASGEGRPAGRDTNNLVESGTLPILRLAHFFLLNDEEDEEHPRGLSKEQIDNLSTRTYGQASLEGELGRTCSVCISEYAQGNKLRRLPCAHEFHIHCIDRWLSENNTCPICRQPILPAHPD